MRRSVEQRLWPRVEFTGFCWLWTGALSKGYGMIRVGGTSRGTHRVAYELLIGPIPDGLELDHLCRVPNCINPDHLDPVTSGENTRRSPTARAAEQARQTHCHLGHPLFGENLLRTPKKRICKTCRAARQAALNAEEYHRDFERTQAAHLARTRSCDRGSGGW